MKIFESEFWKLKMTQQEFQEYLENKIEHTLVAIPILGSLVSGIMWIFHFMFSLTGSTMAATYSALWCLVWPVISIIFFFFGSSAALMGSVLMGAFTVVSVLFYLLWDILSSAGGFGYGISKFLVVNSGRLLFLSTVAVISYFCLAFRNLMVVGPVPVMMKELSRKELEIGTPHFQKTKMDRQLDIANRNHEVAQTWNRYKQSLESSSNDGSWFTSSSSTTPTWRRSSSDDVQKSGIVDPKQHLLDTNKAYDDPKLLESLKPSNFLPAERFVASKEGFFEDLNPKNFHSAKDLYRYLDAATISDMFRYIQVPDHQLIFNKFNQLPYGTKKQVLGDKELHGNQQEFEGNQQANQQQLGVTMAPFSVPANIHYKLVPMAMVLSGLAFTGGPNPGAELYDKITKLVDFGQKTWQQRAFGSIFSALSGAIKAGKIAADSLSGIGGSIVDLYQGKPSDETSWMGNTSGGSPGKTGKPEHGGGKDINKHGEDNTSHSSTTNSSTDDQKSPWARLNKQLNGGKKDIDDSAGKQLASSASEATKSKAIFEYVMETLVSANHAWAGIVPQRDAYGVPVVSKGVSLKKRVLGMVGETAVRAGADESDVWRQTFPKIVTRHHQDGEETVEIESEDEQLIVGLDDDDNSSDFYSEKSKIGERLALNADSLTEDHLITDFGIGRDVASAHVRAMKTKRKLDEEARRTAMYVPFFDYQCWNDPDKENHGSYCDTFMFSLHIIQYRDPEIPITDAEIKEFLITAWKAGIDGRPPGVITPEPQGSKNGSNHAAAGSTNLRERRYNRSHFEEDHDKHSISEPTIPVDHQTAEDRSAAIDELFYKDPRSVGQIREVLMNVPVKVDTVISFRGTQGLSDISADLSFLLNPTAGAMKDPTEILLQTDLSLQQQLQETKNQIEQLKLEQDKKKLEQDKKEHPEKYALKKALTDEKKASTERKDTPSGKNDKEEQALVPAVAEVAEVDRPLTPKEQAAAIKDSLRAGFSKLGNFSSSTRDLWDESVSKVQSNVSNLKETIQEDISSGISSVEERLQLGSTEVAVESLEHPQFSDADRFFQKHGIMPAGMGRDSQGKCIDKSLKEVNQAEFPCVYGGLLDRVQSSFVIDELSPNRGLRKQLKVSQKELAIQKQLAETVSSVELATSKAADGETTKLGSAGEDATAVVARNKQAESEGAKKSRKKKQASFLEIIRQRLFAVKNVVREAQLNILGRVNQKISQQSASAGARQSAWREQQWEQHSLVDSFAITIPDILHKLDSTGMIGLYPHHYHHVKTPVTRDSVLPFGNDSVLMGTLLTGFSLGGGTAELSSVYLRSLERRGYYPAGTVMVISVCSPAMQNPAMTSFIQSNGLGADVAFRALNYRDWVRTGDTYGAESAVIDHQAETWESRYVWRDQVREKLQILQKEKTKLETLDRQEMVKRDELSLQNASVDHANAPATPNVGKAKPVDAGPDAGKAKSTADAGKAETRAVAKATDKAIDTLVDGKSELSAKNTLDLSEKNAKRADVKTLVVNTKSGDGKQVADLPKTPTTAATIGVSVPVAALSNLVHPADTREAKRAEDGKAKDTDAKATAVSVPAKVTEADLKKTAVNSAPVPDATPGVEVLGAAEIAGELERMTELRRRVLAEVFDDQILADTLLTVLEDVAKSNGIVKEIRKIVDEHKHGLIAVSETNIIPITNAVPSSIVSNTMKEKAVTTKPIKQVIIPRRHLVSSKVFTVVESQKDREKFWRFLEWLIVGPTDEKEEKDFPLYPVSKRRPAYSMMFSGDDDSGLYDSTESALGDISLQDVVQSVNGKNGGKNNGKIGKNSEESDTDENDWGLASLMSEIWSIVTESSDQPSVAAVAREVVARETALQHPIVGRKRIGGLRGARSLNEENTWMTQALREGLFNSLKSKGDSFKKIWQSVTVKVTKVGKLLTNRALNFRYDKLPKEWQVWFDNMDRALSCTAIKERHMILNMSLGAPLSKTYLVGTFFPIAGPAQLVVATTMNHSLVKYGAVMRATNTGESLDRLYGRTRKMMRLVNGVNDEVNGDMGRTTTDANNNSGDSDEKTGNLLANAGVSDGSGNLEHADASGGIDDLLSSTKSPLGLPIGLFSIARGLHNLFDWILFPFELAYHGIGAMSLEGTKHALGRWIQVPKIWANYGWRMVFSKNLFSINGDDMVGHLDEDDRGQVLLGGPPSSTITGSADIDASTTAQGKPTQATTKSTSGTRHVLGSVKSHVREDVDRQKRSLLLNAQEVIDMVKRDQEKVNNSARAMASYRQEDLQRKRNSSENSSYRNSSRKIMKLPPLVKQREAHSNVPHSDTLSDTQHSDLDLDDIVVLHDTDKKKSIDAEKDNRRAAVLADVRGGKKPISGGIPIAIKRNEAADTLTDMVSEKPLSGKPVSGKPPSPILPIQPADISDLASSSSSSSESEEDVAEIKELKALERAEKKRRLLRQQFGLVNENGAAQIAAQQRVMTNDELDNMLAGKTRNPDGSITNPDGSITIKNGDGSTITRVKHPDGSITESITNKDGSTTTRNLNADGTVQNVGILSLAASRAAGTVAAAASKSAEITKNTFVGGYGLVAKGLDGIKACITGVGFPMSRSSWKVFRFMLPKFIPGSIGIVLTLASFLEDFIEDFWFSILVAFAIEYAAEPERVNNLLEDWKSTLVKRTGQLEVFFMGLGRQIGERTGKLARYGRKLKEKFYEFFGWETTTQTDGQSKKAIEKAIDKRSEKKKDQKHTDKGNTNHSKHGHFLKEGHTTVPEEEHAVVPHTSHTPVQHAPTRMPERQQKVQQHAPLPHTSHTPVQHAPQVQRQHAPRRKQQTADYQPLLHRFALPIEQQQHGPVVPVMESINDTVCGCSGCAGCETIDELQQYHGATITKTDHKFPLGEPMAKTKMQVRMAMSGQQGLAQAEGIKGLLLGNAVGVVGKAGPLGSGLVDGPVVAAMEGTGTASEAMQAGAGLEEAGTLAMNRAEQNIARIEGQAQSSMASSASSSSASSSSSAAASAASSSSAALSSAGSRASIPDLVQEGEVAEQLHHEADMVEHGVEHYGGPGVESLNEPAPGMESLGDNSLGNVPSISDGFQTPGSSTTNSAATRTAKTNIAASAAGNAPNAAKGASSGASSTVASSSGSSSSSRSSRSSSSTPRSSTTPGGTTPRGSSGSGSSSGANTPRDGGTNTSRDPSSDMESTMRSTVQSASSRLAASENPETISANPTTNPYGNVGNWDEEPNVEGQEAEIEEQTSPPSRAVGNSVPRVAVRAIEASSAKRPLATGNIQEEYEEQTQRHGEDSESALAKDAQSFLAKDAQGSLRAS